MLFPVSARLFKDAAPPASFKSSSLEILLCDIYSPQTGQSMDTTKVQLGEAVSYPGDSYRNVDEVSLTGAEMTQRYMQH